jgi:hypothetical protein
MRNVAGLMPQGARGFPGKAEATQDQAAGKPADRQRRDDVVDVEGRKFIVLFLCYLVSMT